MSRLSSRVNKLVEVFQKREPPESSASASGSASEEESDTKDSKGERSKDSKSERNPKGFKAEQDPKDRDPKDRKLGRNPGDLKVARDTKDLKPVRNTKDLKPERDPKDSNVDKSKSCNISYKPKDTASKASREDTKAVGDTATKRGGPKADDSPNDQPVAAVRRKGAAPKLISRISFTTEDLDLFQSKSKNDLSLGSISEKDKVHLRRTESSVSTQSQKTADKPRRPEEQTVRHLKRRSKSAGTSWARQQPDKVEPAGEKPRVPLKPKVPNRPERTNEPSVPPGGGTVVGRKTPQESPKGGVKAVITELNSQQGLPASKPTEEKPRPIVKPRPSVPVKVKQVGDTRFEQNQQEPPPFTKVKLRSRSPKTVPVVSDQRTEKTLPAFPGDIKKAKGTLPNLSDTKGEGQSEGELQSDKVPCSNAEVSADQEVHALLEVATDAGDSENKKTKQKDIPILPIDTTKVVENNKSDTKLLPDSPGHIYEDIDETETDSLCSELEGQKFPVKLRHVESPETKPKAVPPLRKGSSKVAIQRPTAPAPPPPFRPRPQTPPGKLPGTLSLRPESPTSTRSQTPPLPISVSNKAQTPPTGRRPIQRRADSVKRPEGPPPPAPVKHKEVTPSGSHGTKTSPFQTDGERDPVVRSPRSKRTPIIPGLSKETTESGQEILKIKKRELSLPKRPGVQATDPEKSSESVEDEKHEDSFTPPSLPPKTRDSADIDALKVKSLPYVQNIAQPSIPSDAIDSTPSEETGNLNEPVTDGKSISSSLKETGSLPPGPSPRPTPPLRTKSKSKKAALVLHGKDRSNSLGSSGTDSHTGSDTGIEAEEPVRPPDLVRQKRISGQAVDDIAEALATHAVWYSGEPGDQRGSGSREDSSSVTSERSTKSSDSSDVKTDVSIDSQRKGSNDKGRKTKKKKEKVIKGERKDSGGSTKFYIVLGDGVPTETSTDEVGNGDPGLDELVPAAEGRGTGRNTPPLAIQGNLPTGPQNCEIVEVTEDEVGSNDQEYLDIGDESLSGLNTETDDIKEPAQADSSSGTPSGVDTDIYEDIPDDQLENSFELKRDETTSKYSQIQDTVGAEDFAEQTCAAILDTAETTEQDVLNFSESDSDCEYFDEDSFTDSEEENIYANITAPVETTENEESQPMSKLQRIANEILTTEKAYVDRLYIVDQVFHFKVVLENRSNHMFPDDVIPQMFSNIKSIYQFHHDFLLPQLEKRMAEWDKHQKIGDLMKTFAPFLKLYSDYVKNFDSAMNIISTWSDRCTRFAAIMDEVQKMPECRQLSIQHHMLEPIQRVPRYELLLKDYVRHLPEDSDDLSDAKRALELVSTAASHSNDAMKKIETFRRLLEINESLGGTFDLISPTRELVKEGKIIKISARNGDQQERYLFVFNDMLLVCSSQLIEIRQHYRIKATMDIEGMQVLEGNNLEVPNTFLVKSKQKTIEFHTRTIEEKTEWQVTLLNVVADYTKKQLSRQTGLEMAEQFLDQQLGRRAPTWIKDQETSMCMLCSSTFTAFRRRHHCRACGIVVCGKCSNHKAKLTYDEDRPNRVCDKCYKTLEGRSDVIYGKLASSSGQKRKGVLQVKASDKSVISSYLQMSCDKKSWQKRWFAIHDDFVLYSFKAHQDVAALTSMPMPGYEVCEADKDEILDKEHVFKVFHKHQKKIYFFATSDKSLLQRWMGVLEKVVMAELPDPLAPLAQEETS